MSVAQHMKDKHDTEVKARNARPLLSVSEALRNLCEAVGSQREEDIANALHDGRRASIDLGGWCFDMTTAPKDLTKIDIAFLNEKNEPAFHHDVWWQENGECFSDYMDGNGNKKRAGWFYHSEDQVSWFVANDNAYAWRSRVPPPNRALGE